MPKDKKSPKPEKDARSSKPKTELKASLECPRCKMTLGPAKYEGVNVDFCDTCWGYWVGLYQFETILTSKDEVFSKEEKQSKAATHPGDGKPLACARCSHHMQKLQVRDEWDQPAFFIDYCQDHGLWLDTGEIKRAQILDERTGNVRKALKATLKGKAMPGHEREDDGD